MTNHSYLELQAEKKRLTGVRTNISTTYHGQKKQKLRLFNLVIFEVIDKRRTVGQKDI